MGYCLSHVHRSHHVTCCVIWQEQCSICGAQVAAGRGAEAAAPPHPLCTALPGTVHHHSAQEFCVLLALPPVQCSQVGRAPVSPRSVPNQQFGCSLTCTSLMIYIILNANMILVECWLLVCECSTKSCPTSYSFEYDDDKLSWCDQQLQLWCIAQHYLFLRA